MVKEKKWVRVKVFEIPAFLWPHGWNPKGALAGTKSVLGAERNFLELGLHVDAVRLEASLGSASGTLASGKHGPQTEVSDKRF